MKSTSRMKTKATSKPATALVHFTYHNGEAAEVFVAGSFNSWLQDWNARQSRMNRDEQGGWTLDLPVTPGTHEYLFVVDGRWTPDPQARDYVPNPFGGFNSVLVVETTRKASTRKRRLRS